MTDPMPVIKGTLDVLVLKALTWQPMHGYELTQWIEKRSRHRLELEDAALYQALYRLEKRKLVDAEWGYTDQGRRARYYTITSSGKSNLAAQTAWWSRYAATLTDLLSQSPSGG